MKERTRQELSEVMAELIGQILHDPTAYRSMSALAQGCGYSPFHFARCFQELTGESPAAFVRRIRLERAAYRLRSGARVGDVAEDGNPEAFSRLFRRRFGSSPSRFKTTLCEWKLPSPHDLHWLPEWDAGLDWRALRLRYPTRFEVCGPMRLAVVRCVGNYAHLGQMWHSILPLLAGLESSTLQWVTVYHDSMYTAPSSNCMRADIGFVCEGPAPEGFNTVVIPRGPVVKTIGHVARSQRDESWKYLSAQWPHTWSWDEYRAWPLPFEQVETRICIRPD